MFVRARIHKTTQSLARGVSLDLTWRWLLRGLLLQRLGKYLIKEEIGRGGFGVVSRGVHVDTGQQVAIKRIRLSAEANLESEIGILKRLKHKHIVRLFDVLRSQNNIYLVLEYCPSGDLRKLIGRGRGLQESQVRSFTRQLGEGLRYLRQNGIVHRDLKPGNILQARSSSGRDPVLKIADFGLARHMGPQSMAATWCGTPVYMAPEVLSAAKYSASADLWSVGVILHEMATGKRPFSAPNQVQLLRNIQKTGRGLRLSEEVRERLSDDLCDLIEALLRTNPKQRISFEDFFAHRFITGRAPQRAAGQDAKRRAGVNPREGLFLKRPSQLRVSELGPYLRGRANELGLDEHPAIIAAIEDHEYNGKDLLESQNESDGMLLRNLCDGKLGRLRRLRDALEKLKLRD